MNHSGKLEKAIILLYDRPIGSDYYDPLKPIPSNTSIQFLRLNRIEEIKNKNMTKYLVRHDETK